MLLNNHKFYIFIKKIKEINNQTLKKTDVDSIIKEVGEAPKTTA